MGDKERKGDTDHQKMVFSVKEEGVGKGRIGKRK